MSTVYDGLASNVTTPLAATVSGATNASPIVITTSANHLYGTGDKVNIAGVLGNTAANGFWTITVLSSTTFSLTGSTGSGAYTSGRVCTDYSMTPQTTLPSDGDVFNAAAWNVPISTALDRTQALAAQGAPLPSLTALAAITAPANGLIRHVLGFGWYVFQTSATTGLSPFRVAATDATAGGWQSSTAHETTRTVVVPCSNITCITGGAGAAGGIDPTGATSTVSFVPIGAADATIWPPSLLSGRTITAATLNFGYLLPLDAFLADGATLATATLNFHPVAGHGSVPTRMPRIAVCRSALTGYLPTVVNLLSTTGGYAVFATPGSTAAYQVDNSLVFTSDQNNVIDRTSFRYFAIIFDDAGTGAIVGNAFTSVTLSLTNIPDARRS